MYTISIAFQTILAWKVQNLSVIVAFKYKFENKLYPILVFTSERIRIKLK